MYSRRNLEQTRQTTDTVAAPVDWDAMFDAPTMTWDEAVMGSLRDHLAKNPPQPPPPEVTETTAICGSTRVWLVREGERWEMYAGSRKRGRRTDFASFWLRHSMEVAEDWYGPAIKGWAHQGVKMPSQDSPE
jgi:hypothetical protein